MEKFVRNVAIKYSQGNFAIYGKFLMVKKRDYSYDTKYENSPEQIKHREMRNKARYDVVHHIHAAAHGIKPEDIKGKDIDHKIPLKKGGTNNPSNWRIRSVHANRGDKK